jgi:hypothetical protein
VVTTLSACFAVVVRFPFPLCPFSPFTNPSHRTQPNSSTSGVPSAPYTTRLSPSPTPARSTTKRTSFLLDSFTLLRVKRGISQRERRVRSSTLRGIGGTTLARCSRTKVLFLFLFSIIEFLSQSSELTSLMTCSPPPQVLGEPSERQVRNDHPSHCLARSALPRQERRSAEAEHRSPRSCLSRAGGVRFATRTRRRSGEYCR